ncbi:MAG: hypothetical protein U0271_47755 [Polyangiaceae bacterium]
MNIFLKAVASLAIFLGLVNSARAEDAESAATDGQSEVFVCDNAVVVRSSCEAPPTVIVVNVTTEPQYHFEQRRRPRLWGTGVAIFGASYGLTVLFSALSRDEALIGASVVPVAGPLAVMALVPEEGRSVFSIGLFTLFAAAQAASAGMILGGVFKHTSRVRDAVATTFAEVEIGAGWAGLKVGS